VEAQAPDVAEAPAGAAAPPGAESARGVLDDRQVGQLLEPRGPPEEVDGEDRARLATDLDARRIDVHRLRIDVHQHGVQPRERDDVRSRGKRVRGHQHLVAGLQPEREHGEMERRRARRDGNRVLHLARVGDSGLELRDTRAHRQHPALEDGRDLRELRLADVGPA
jgi:hypothetical protein